MLQSNKKTILYQNSNLGTVLTETIAGSRKRTDLILTLDKLILARYDEEDRVIENSQVVTNSDLPIFQSFIVDPQGSDRIVLTLTNNADSGKVFATNGDVTAFNGYIKGVQIEHNTNKLTVFLSENRAGNIRINVMYMKL